MLLKVSSGLISLSVSLLFITLPTAAMAQNSTQTETEIVTNTVYVSGCSLSTSQGPLITSVYTAINGYVRPNFTHTAIWTEYNGPHFWNSPKATHTLMRTIPGTTLPPYETTITTRATEVKTLTPPAIATDEAGHMKEISVQGKFEPEEIAGFVFFCIVGLLSLGYFLMMSVRCCNYCLKEEREAYDRQMQNEIRQLPDVVSVELQSFGESEGSKNMVYKAPFQRSD